MYNTSFVIKCGSEPSSLQSRRQNLHLGCQSGTPRLVQTQFWCSLLRILTFCHTILPYSHVMSCIHHIMYIMWFHKMYYVVTYLGKGRARGDPSWESILYHVSTLNLNTVCEKVCARSVHATCNERIRQWCPMFCDHRRHHHGGHRLNGQPLSHQQALRTARDRMLEHGLKSLQTMKSTERFLFLMVHGCFL